MNFDTNFDFFLQRLHCALEHSYFLIQKLFHYSRKQEMKSFPHRYPVLIISHVYPLFLPKVLNVWSKHAVDNSFQPPNKN